MWDQNKSFLSVRTAESNRKRTWFQSPSLVFWESNCLSGGKRYFKKWKDTLRSERTEFWFLFISCFKRCLFPVWRFCVPWSLTGCDWLSRRGGEIDSIQIQDPLISALRLSSGAGRKKKKKSALRLLSQVSPFFHRSSSLAVRILLLPGLEEMGVDFIVSQNPYPRPLKEKAFPGDGERKKPQQYV